MKPLCKVMVMVLVCTLMSIVSKAQTHSGPVVIDSSLYVKDSVMVEKNLTVDRDMKVKGDGTYTGELKAKSTLKVLGTAKLKGDGYVEGTFKFKGLADPTATDHRMLSINANGKVGTLQRSTLLANTYSADCFTLTDGTNTAYPAPVWASASGPSFGILSTGTGCPAWVGIGTSAPSRTLDVRGGGYFSASLGVGGTATPDIKLYVETDEHVAVCVNQTYTDDYGYGVKTLVQNDNTKGFALFNTTYGANGEDVFRVYGNGVVEAKKVEVTLTGWSDFVFEKDYQLPSLFEVEQFIESNGHLPGVPSEEEVLEEGVDLGEMDAILLQKVEELTLYMIQLNKELEALKAQNAALQQQLDNQ